MITFQRFTHTARRKAWACLPRVRNLGAASSLNARHITDIIAIDGPAGAGKSSVAREAARRLGYAFLDTGAMYRAATWWVLQRGVELANPEAIAAAVEAMPLELEETDGGLRVYVGGEDVTDAIRTPEVTAEIWRVDELKPVRRQLVALQREFGARRPTVAEGRDMGTVVFPEARCKLYLDAGIEERARRRARELAERGETVDLNELMAAIRERDERSMKRAESPLRQAPDAERIDTTGLGFDEVVERVVEKGRAALCR